MSIKAAYRNGVFEDVEDAKPGGVYTVFSDEELRDIRETLGSFELWNNSSDAVYDTL